MNRCLGMVIKVSTSLFKHLWNSNIMVTNMCVMGNIEAS